MSIRDKWAEGRERSRRQREAYEANERRTRKGWELRRMGVEVTDWSLTEETLDAMLVAERERQADLYKEFERAKTVSRFRALGVQVPTGSGQVYTIGEHDRLNETDNSRFLGPLAGAEATITEITQAFSPGKALVMPIALTPLARKDTAEVLNTFTSGATRTIPLDSSQQVRDARKQVVEFNTFVKTHTGNGESASAGPDPAERLAEVARLHDAGLLTDEEYTAKRAEIISQL